MAGQPLRLVCAHPGCARVLPAPKRVYTLRALRSVAHRYYQWSTRGRDLCPKHKDGAH